QQMAVGAALREKGQSLSRSAYSASAKASKSRKSSDHAEAREAHLAAARHHRAAGDKDQASLHARAALKHRDKASATRNVEQAPGIVAADPGPVPTMNEVLRRESVADYAGPETAESARGQSTGQRRRDSNRPNFQDTSGGTDPRRSGGQRFAGE